MAFLLREGNAEELLNRERELQVKCGPCMEPTFHEGQIAHIIPTSRFVAGMVALIRTDQNFVLHRLLEIDPPWALHGGEGNDPPKICRLSSILGISSLHSVKVISGSMVPTISPGARVPVEQIPPHTGEVALMWGKEKPQVHRILGMAGNWVIHAGDAAPIPGIAAKTDIVGVVRVPCPAHLPAARYAHALGLLLKTGSVLHQMGIPTTKPLRTGMRLIKKLLSGFFLRR